MHYGNLTRAKSLILNGLLKCSHRLLSLCYNYNDTESRSMKQVLNHTVCECGHKEKLNLAAESLLNFYAVKCKIVVDLCQLKRYK